jgi:hypothetical protein
MRSIVLPTLRPSEAARLKSQRYVGRGRRESAGFLFVAAGMTVPTS